MGLHDLSETEFVDVLNRYLLPSHPIKREELLRGRSSQLDQIKKSLLSPGRNVFVYGERGVGKTSLANTAAFLHHHSSSNPIEIACDPSATFYMLIKLVAAKLIAESPLPLKSSRVVKAKADLKFLSLEIANSLECGSVPLPTSLEEALGIVSYCAAGHPTPPVVIVDEFDRLREESDRGLFGDFVKQVGDRDIPIKLIFCGVGSSLEDLLAGHESSFRYLAGVKLERLDWEPRLEIVSAAAEALDVEISRDYLFRIATISDGFPHYIHLVGRYLFWEVFEDDAADACVNADHFSVAVQKSSVDVEPHLTNLYAMATQKYGNEYQYILWAMADHPDFTRRSADIYDSCTRIMADLEEEPISRKTFNARMNSLKRESHGAVLLGSRQGWYEFKEPVLRGYCRLKATEHGVVLDRDHYFNKKPEL